MTMRYLVVAAVLALAAPAASALDVPMTLTETAGVERKGDPVSVGVPIPRGALKDVAGLCVLDPAGKKVPAQFEVTGWWWPTAKYPEEAKSVRWVLADFQADVSAKGQAVYRLTDGGGNPAPEKPVAVKGPEGGVTVVETGPLSLKVSEGAFKLFESVSLDGKAVVAAGENDGICVEGMDGKRYYASRDLKDPPQLTDADYRGEDAYLKGSAHNPPKKLRVTVERAGPLRAVVMIDGVMQAMSAGGEYPFQNYEASGDKGELLKLPCRDEQIGFRIRIHAYAGKPFVRVFHTLINLRGQSATKTDMERYRSAMFMADACKSPGKFLIEALELGTTLKLDGPAKYALGGEAPSAGELAAGKRLTMYQDSTAGWTWQVGEDKITDPVIKANMEFLKVKPGLEKPFYEYSDIHHKILTGQDGYSFMGYRVLDGEGQKVAEGNRSAGWADLSDGKAGLTAAVRWFWQMCPKSLAVDGSGRLTVGLLPREWGRGHFLDGKIHRTHEMLYRFHGAEQPAAAEMAVRAFNKPLVAYCGFETYLGSGTCGLFARPDPQNWPTYEGQINTAVHVGVNPKVNPARDSSYEVEREKDDAYGWEHFGDTSKRGFRGHSQFEEFDSSRCLLMHFYRTGDPEFFYTGEELDRFLMNIPCFGGGYGHQHPESSHNWIQGLIDYYHLTGLAEAREGIEAMEGFYRNCQDPGAQNWHFNGRNAAYALNGLRQFFEWTGDPKWLSAANRNIVSVRQRTRPVSGFYGGNPGWFMNHVLCHALGRYALLTGDDDAVDLLLGLATHFKPFSKQCGGGDDADCYAYATMLTGDRRYLEAATAKLKDADAADKEGPMYRTGTASSKTWSGGVGGYYQIYFHAAKEWKPQDTTPPDPVTDLAAEPGPEPGSVKLTWTNTGDDGAKGRAARLQIKYAPGEIVEFIPWGRKQMDAEVAPEWQGKVNFWYAENAAGEPAPEESGQKQSWTLKGLPSGKALYFALALHDRAGNRSKPSNSVKVTVP